VAPGEQVDERRTIHAPEEPDGRPGERLQATSLRSIADDHELAAKPGACLHGLVQPAVGEHPRRDDEIAVVSGRQRDAGDVDRWIDQLRLPPPEAPDPLADRL
jgi:hypothetical protein